MFKMGWYNDTILNTIQRHLNSFYEIQLAFLTEDQLDYMFQNFIYIYICTLYIYVCVCIITHSKNKQVRGGLVKFR